MRLAARGARNLDAGENKLEDEVVEEILRKQALKVYAESIALGLVLTLPFVFL